MRNCNKICNFCANTIGKYIDCKCIIQKVNDIHYDLRPTDYGMVKKIINMHDIEVEAIKMKNNFYVAFNFSCVKQRQSYEMSDVSLQFFTESAPIARAEWMNVEFHPETHSYHPQPHWHIAPKVFMAVEENESKGFMELLNDETNDILYTEPNFYKFTTLLEEQKKLKFEDLHYAMCSKWAEGQDSCNLKLNEENFKKWLPLCMASFCKQLEYLSRKTPDSHS